MAGSSWALTATFSGVLFAVDSCSLHNTEAAAVAVQQTVVSWIKEVSSIHLRLWSTNNNNNNNTESIDNTEPEQNALMIVLVDVGVSGRGGH